MVCSSSPKYKKNNFIVNMEIMFFIEYRVIDPLVRDQMLTRISATTFVYFNMIPIDCCTVLQYNQN